jgi:hypothetical protein
MKLFRVAVLFSLLAMPVLAQTAPSSDAAKGFDFTQPILDADSSKVALPQSDPKAEPKYYTLGMLAAQALAQNDGKESAKEIVQRGELAIRVVDGKSVSLDSAEIGMIEAAMAKYTSNAVAVARVMEMIDPNAVKK